VIVFVVWLKLVEGEVVD